MGFKSQHNLLFEVAPYHMQFCDDIEWKLFRVGTCQGLWTSIPSSYDILAIDNMELNNGHLNDVFQWFERSCKRDKKSLRILEVWNKRFKKHLIEKRRFVDIGNDNLEKKF